MNVTLDKMLDDITNILNHFAETGSNPGMSNLFPNLIVVVFKPLFNVRSRLSLYGLKWSMQTASLT